MNSDASRTPPARPMRRDEARRGGDGEDLPRAAPGGPCFPIGEGAPHPRGQHADAVPDGTGDAADQSLDQAGARQQRGGERQAHEDQRPHCCATLGVQTAATLAMATEIGTGRASDERLMFTVSA
jgi:hypothetical protein